MLRVESCWYRASEEGINAFQSHLELQKILVTVGSRRYFRFAAGREEISRIDSRDWAIRKGGKFGQICIVGCVQQRPRIT